MLLFTVQPKIDTKGHCYTLALQQMLTGVYIAELSLLGLFSLRSATGPAIMLAILLVITVIYNVVMNRYFGPLEQYLPADLAIESEDGNGDDDEEAPLLSEDGHPDSHIHRLAQRTPIPAKVVDPVARFFEPHIFASHKAMRVWLKDGDFDDEDVSAYKDEEVAKAYLNPAFTSSTPVVWLARDPMGVSKAEIAANEKEGLKSSDEGAWIDGEGTLRWSERDFDEVPIFKESVKW
jgi:hypothetical protein